MEKAVKSHSDRAYSNKELGLLYAAWLALFLFILARAWVAEDAYITFRVIDNFMNGYGLRWNTFERVQAYTHPLWMLLHIPLVAIWPNLFLVSISLSVTCSSMAALVSLATAHKPVPTALTFFFLPLALSKSFMDYTSSGLENPLSYLLFAAFGHVLMKRQEHPRFWLLASLCLAGALLNRLDSIILYAPAAGYVSYTRWNDIRWRQVLLGFAPLAAWFTFSLFYYGFLFPNTKYAKLGTDMSLLLYITQGLHYVQYLLIWDTPGLLLLLSALVFVLQPKRFQADGAFPMLPAAIAVGVIWNACYVIYVGGDYMAGRFWAVPIFVTAWLWLMFFPARPKLDILASVAVALLAATGVPPLLRNIHDICDICIPLKGKVLDATHIFSSNDLFKSYFPPAIRRQGKYSFANDGKKLAEETPPPTKVLFFIGMPGYYAGPQVKIIDQLGLADPLLARLPASHQQGFYIGHFRRDIPKGYEQALKTGSLDAMPPNLAKYYEKLQFITQGDLWNMDRLQTILYFNLGYYDFWKQQYVDSHNG